MRSSREQNPPPGNAPESREAPEAANARDSDPRRDEGTSWFAPPPLPERGPAEQRAASGGEYRAPSASDPRPVPPPLDEPGPDDLYPPDYRAGGTGIPFRADMAPRPRDAGSQPREQAPARGAGAGDRPPPREPDAGNRGPNAYPEWFRDAPAPDTTDRMPVSERFSWSPPNGQRENPAAQPRTPPLSAHWEEREDQWQREKSGQLPRIAPPGNGAYNPYAGSVPPAPDRPPVAPTGNPVSRPNGETPRFGGNAPRFNGEAPFAPYSGQFASPPLGAMEGAVENAAPPPMRASGALPTTGMGTNQGTNGGTYRAAPPSPASLAASGGIGSPIGSTRSGRLTTAGQHGVGQYNPSGSFAAVPGRSPLPLPSVAPVSDRSSARPLITDAVVLAFLGLALALTAAMVAFIALRFNTFPQQITLHFGPAGVSQRDRIGERRELWTIPFLSGIVFVANTALAFVFDFFDRHDRFVPRLLAIGNALVAAVAWVVLLTLLYR